jgi:hypothetical protein
MHMTQATDPIRLDEAGVEAAWLAHDNACPGEHWKKRERMEAAIRAYLRASSSEAGEAVAWRDPKTGLVIKASSPMRGNPLWDEKYTQPLVPLSALQSLHQQLDEARKETKKAYDRGFGEAMATFMPAEARLASLEASGDAPSVMDHKFIDGECHASGCQALVWRSRYESAVKGRADFREVYRKEREARKTLEASGDVVEALWLIPESFIADFVASRAWTAARNLDVISRKDAIDRRLEADWLKEFIPAVAALKTEARPAARGVTEDATDGSSVLSITSAALSDAIAVLRQLETYAPDVGVDEFLDAVRMARSLIAKAEGR